MNVRIVALVTNIPGPLAASRLAGLGARVVKLEPIAGDPLAASAPGWYSEITRSMHVVRTDLKTEAGRANLDESLAGSDLLITSMRAGAIARLGLSWNDLHGRFSDLCHVAIFGEAYPNDDRSGHDLTYQARAGLLVPPAMPQSVFADLFAAERAVSAALNALYERDRTGVAARFDIAIEQVAQTLTAPAHYGLTSEGGPLSGTLPEYRLYRTSDGWLALAALEPHFQTRVMDVLELQALDAASLEARFEEHSSSYWETLACEHDLPLATL